MLRLPRIDLHISLWACHASHYRQMASTRDSDGQVAVIGVQQVLPMPHRHPGASVRHWQSADAINTCLKVDASFARKAVSTFSLALPITRCDWPGLANCMECHRAVPNPLPCAQSNGRVNSECSGITLQRSCVEALDSLKTPVKRSKVRHSIRQLILNKRPHRSSIPAMSLFPEIARGRRISQ